MQGQVVVAQTKNVGTAIILTTLLGPLGMLYSTILGGVLMGIISSFVALVTLGFGLLFTWPICVIWAALAASSHNNRLMQQSGPV